MWWRCHIPWLLSFLTHAAEVVEVVERVEVVITGEAVTKEGATVVVATIELAMATATATALWKPLLLEAWRLRMRLSS
jgi:hypothetical protein